MGLWQKIYDGIKNWKTPMWVKILLGQLNDLMIDILKQAGQQYINFVKIKVIEAAQHKDWSNEEKFDYVFNAAKEGLLEFSITLKDNEIESIIQFFVSAFKKSGAIK